VERSAGPDDERERLDGYPDELVPEAAAPDPRPEDARQQALAVWGASDGARPDVTDAADLHRAPPVVDAEKLAVLALVARAQDAQSLRARRPVPRARLAWAAELCTPDAVQFAEQSCAEPEAAQTPHWQQALPGEARPLEAAVRQKLKPEAQAASQQREEAQLDAAAPEKVELQPEAQRASPRWEQRLQAARPEVARRESAAQPEVALVLQRERQPLALPRQEALQAELAALLLLPSFA
jgi:hypothetical protein